MKSLKNGKFEQFESLKGEVANGTSLGGSFHMKLPMAHLSVEVFSLRCWLPRFACASADKGRASDNAAVSAPACGFDADHGGQRSQIVSTCQRTSMCTWRATFTCMSTTRRDGVSQQPRPRPRRTLRLQGQRSCGSHPLQFRPRSQYTGEAS